VIAKCKERHSAAHDGLRHLHVENPRLEDAVRGMNALGVKYIRTGLSLADSRRPDAQAWFDRQMKALDGHVLLHAGV
jgi:hypothetical protein